MEILVSLFPFHSRTELEKRLEEAGGAVEQVAAALLDSADPPAPTAPAGPAPAQTNNPTPNRSDSHNSAKTAKRQKPLAAPFPNGVVDLTWSDGDDNDEENNGGPVGPPPQADVFEIEDDIFDVDDSPQPQPPTSVLGGSNVPSFEDFHLQEQKRIEDRRLKELQAEEQRKALVENFVANAQVMFENISVPYLERLIAEKRPKIASDEELVDACIDTISKTNGKYPKAKRKRGADEDGNESNSEDDDDDEMTAGIADQGSSTSQSNPRAKRDFYDCTLPVDPRYMVQAEVLGKFSFHYVPAFEYINKQMIDLQDPGKGKKSTKAGEVRLVENKKRRNKKQEAPLNTLDPNFRKELLWIRAKIEKEQAEISEALAEEENLRKYTESNNLKECGCCFDDVPANRIAMCEEGHIFCLSCSRQGAEVELGYRRTVLKCMTAGCKAVFPDSEAELFLAKSVFEGLLRARQQSELKMAGLDSLVECPFCSYAAIVENDEDKEFRCEGPKCRKVSCRFCKALTHIPLSCEEFRKELEKDNVLSVQHKVEEEMSQALIRECPKCKSRFFKTEGCNKMTCPQCHTNMCYVCKVQIKDYSHFDQSPAGHPAKKKSLCRLWEDTVQRNNDEVKAAAQKTLQELKTRDPDLASQVRLDIPK
ncbi:hypothetical protein BGX23_008793 [Mortierella sp. AD031]|nr:hypothetical protein BGX23_008793 [Mortierella sp. AD031]